MGLYGPLKSTWTISIAPIQVSLYLERFWAFFGRLLLSEQINMWDFTMFFKTPKHLILYESYITLG